MKYSIFIVEDHPVARQGFATFIGQAPDLTVCGEAGSVTEALDAIPGANPDLTIIDIGLDGSSGVELMKQLRERLPELKMLVVSMHDEMLYAERALRAGAGGYIMKSATASSLLEAIHTVLSGRVYVSGRVQERLLERRMLYGFDAAASPVASLSDRELEVFRNVGQGCTTREIAVRMEVSPRTVGTYRERIKQKLGIESGTELIRRATAWVERQGE